MKLKDKLVNYISANYPILYIRSYEEENVDSIIAESSLGRKILEWNGVYGAVEFETKSSLNLLDCSLAGMLRLVLNDDVQSDNTIIVLKDIASLLSEPEVISLLKCYASKIIGLPEEQFPSMRRCSS